MWLHAVGVIVVWCGVESRHVGDDVRGYGDYESGTQGVFNYVGCFGRC